MFDLREELSIYLPALCTTEFFNRDNAKQVIVPLGR